MNENQIKDCDTWAERATNQKAEIARIPKHLVSAPANQLSLLSLMLNTCRSGFVMATRENKMFISHSLSWMSDERSTFRFTEYLVILELVIFFLSRWLAEQMWKYTSSCLGGKISFHIFIDFFLFEFKSKPSYLLTFPPVLSLFLNQFSFFILLCSCYMNSYCREAHSGSRLFILASVWNHKFSECMNGNAFSFLLFLPFFLFSLFGKILSFLN